ncbi:MAG TPA: nucleotidyltransferase domain-containing protein [Nitrospiraceae bacterium]|nr:nucleotidyltransferase domain-containing protein [Nitrospiraceae bacterium]
MQTKRHNLDKTGRQAVQDRLKKVLEKRPEVCFGYVHGSFVSDDAFADVDVAVFLYDRPETPLQYELALESALMEAVHPYQADVRILNSASLSFRYQVIKGGIPLSVQDDERRTSFQEATLADYFDFAPFRAMYLRETLGTGV